MIAQLPLVEMIVERVAELDETFDNGAVPEFLITFEAARADVKRRRTAAAMRQHFDRAIEISQGKRAGTYVSFAENACLPAQNAAEFKAMLEKALAIDADADPNTGWRTWWRSAAPMAARAHGRAVSGIRARTGR